MILQIDFYILNAIQSMRTGFLDLIMPYITYLGSGGFIWILTTVILLFFKKTRRAGIAVGIALLTGYLISTVGLKNLFARERPFNTAGALLDVNSLLIGTPSDRFSFPSGHTLSSVSSATVLLYFFRKKAVPALILSVLIAFSRLYLYVHFPTDVLGGAVLGILFALIAVKSVNFIWRKKDENKLSADT